MMQMKKLFVVIILLNALFIEGKTQRLPRNARIDISAKRIDKMLGADISFLPELESKGLKFYDKGLEKDAIEILKDHGFNYIRLRIFNNPSAYSGYSPKKGFCDLAHTIAMAKRVKAAGMKFLLDFHYSDYWADPGKQYKPSAWKAFTFTDLTRAVHDYTASVLRALKTEGVLPDMVQVGNEINHGMIWPEGHIKNLDSLTQLVKAGIIAVREVSPASAIMLHAALGGQNAESVFFIENMLKRGVEFDVLGMSYYPKWHGTLDDLQNNLSFIANKYSFDILVVEYSEKKREVNEIAFNLPGNKGKGTAIWEPLSWGEKIVDDNGKTNNFILIYDEISKKYLDKK